MTPRIPLAYTFGNHMHWVDMQWLWGYDVLPGSTQDMLAYCKQAGVKGNVNFDGVGYEKMAAESPEHLALLRETIKAGTIEVVGGSYGQPYGLFHGGESNIRQRIYGVRTAIRVLGTRPRTFWEEEFDFYPQLPQMLAGCGFTGASLYFQWTWHTPEVPMEDAPVVLWEGIDGTKIPTATRNRMNLHQWPEDFQILLDDLAANPPESGDIPLLVLQWLELMPTQDWMCRSELMLPMLAELKKDPRFEVIALTLGEYLAKWKAQDLPVRQYKLDDVWHGMTLGKNGDNHPRESARLELAVRESESAAAILSLFGRPYDPWDVYPTWEIEEMWRMLLAFQHHDNHECEGLCGYVTVLQTSGIETLLSNNGPLERLARRVLRDRDEDFLFNVNGSDIFIKGLKTPAFGYRIKFGVPGPDPKWTIEGHIATYESENFRVRIDIETITILELTNSNGVLENIRLPFVYGKGGQPQVSDHRADTRHAVDINGGTLEILTGPVDVAKLYIRPLPESEELGIGLTMEGGIIDPGFGGSIRVQFPLQHSNPTIRSNSPFAVQEVGKGSAGKRKYPEGDWMTSPQWFEAVEGAFTSQSFVDISYSDHPSLLITHGGSQQWFRHEDRLENVLMAIDPWDGDKSDPSGDGGFRLYVHKGLSNSDCLRRAAQMEPNFSYRSVWLPPDRRFKSGSNLPDLPDNFAAVTVHARNVIASAFYREQESFCKRGLTNYAGEGMGHPFILRLVEYDGIAGEIEVTLPGPIAKAFKTNLMGEIVGELTPLPDDAAFLTSEPEKLKPFGIEAGRIKVPMRPYEIATIYLDIVPGRKQFRDLDAKREIWATVHRTED